jgi:hypothetical protein
MGVLEDGVMLVLRDFGVAKLIMLESWLARIGRLKVDDEEQIVRGKESPYREWACNGGCGSNRAHD